jgi:hypothetical protein
MVVDLTRRLLRVENHTTVSHIDEIVLGVVHCVFLAFKKFPPLSAP